MMKCLFTEYNGSTWEWRILGVADPGSGEFFYNLARILNIRSVYVYYCKSFRKCFKILFALKQTITDIIFIMTYDITHIYIVAF